MHKKFGFTLIEILITLVIIGILAMYAVPAYHEHVAKARRTAAETVLVQLASALESYYMSNNSYQGATLQSLGFSELIVKNTYQLSIANLTDTHYALTAVPLGDQAEYDQACGVLTLNSTGEKGAKQDGCW